MVDYTRPIRLSNGKRAEVTEILPDGHARVRIWSAYAPHVEGQQRYDGDMRIWNYNALGRWSGGRDDFYTIVNSDDPSELINEEW